MNARAVEVLAPRLDAIPGELKPLPWAVWNAELRDNGKVAKAPRHPITGVKIAANDPTQWGTFDECRSAVEAGRVSGLGVLMDGTAGLVGIDIDDWRETAEQHPELNPLLERTRDKSLYVEQSPGGRGLRAFVRAELPGDKGRRSGKIELYSTDRFLTVTGHGTGVIADGQWLIDALLELIGADVDSSKVASVPAEGNHEVDAQVVERLADFAAKREPRLWAGEWQRSESDLGTVGYESQSDADLALAGAIARLAASEGAPRAALAATVEAVFNKSGLADRDKWRTRGDYRERTIGKAISDVQPQRQVPDTLSDAHGDVFSAEEFAKANWGRLSYVPQLGKWLQWNSAVWATCERGEEMQAAKVVTQRMLAKGAELLATEPDKAKRLINHAVKSQSLPRLEAMLRLGSTEGGMSVALADLDADPWLLGVRNGVVDLRTGGLLDARPDMLITKQCGAAYDMFAECPAWDGFLNGVFQGDAATIETVQRALGYTLTGSNTEEVLFICHGFGANGKSVFSNIVRAILGDYGRTAPASLLTVRRDGDTGVRNDLAMLAGARYVAINELQSGDRLDEQIVKQLAGREPVAARFLHREYFEFTPQFSPWLRTNHRPVVTGDDDGIWRRLVLIPFRRQFAEHERDPHLEHKLLAERDGILAWMVAGALKWRRDGLKLSPAIRQKNLAYRNESDLLGEYIADQCRADPNERVEQSKLYGSWRDWCEACGVRCGSKASFTRKLNERGFAEARSGSKRFYSGLAFRVGE